MEVMSEKYCFTYPVNWSRREVLLHTQLFGMNKVHSANNFLVLCRADIKASLAARPFGTKLCEHKVFA